MPALAKAKTRPQALSDRLMDLHDRLLGHFGPQHWWPGESAFEVMVGAVLTQNTNWQNVDRALTNLKEKGLLHLEGLLATTPEELAGLIKPVGYFNVKQRRLRNLLEAVAQAGGLEAIMTQPTPQARELLLGVNGVGPETADAILCYCGDHPVFVVDAYTWRVMERHGLAGAKWPYARLQALFMDHLPQKAALFNELHALIVRLGSTLCKKSTPLCDGCPLEGF